jgi:pimeloyl-ACP methyl ester carboxylesterase
MKHAQRSVELGDGADTTVESWGERGPIVLCVHGMTSSRRSWERLARHLGGGFRVYAYDQRGHGDSTAIPGPMTLDRGMRDACAIAEALGEPIEVLVGHSWGGAVAILAGERFSVARVVAIDPMIRNADATWYGEYLAELTEQFALYGGARDEAVRNEYAQWHPLDVEAKVHAVHAMTTAPIEGLLRENPPEAWDLRPAIARYQIPLLLALAARGEGINDDATVDEIERNRSPLVEIVTFPGAGHNIHRTAFDEFAAAFDRFLTKTS